LVPALGQPEKYQQMLTNAQIRNAKRTEKPWKVADGGGLDLLVAPNGGRYWRYNYRFNGKQTTLSLGVYPDVTLAMARSRHQRARQLLADAIDPGVERDTSEKTFEGVAREWHTHWKPTTLSLNEKTVAINALRRVVPKMPQCNEPEGKEKMIPYADYDIIFVKAYRSASDEVLLGERLNGTRSICGFFDDEHFFDYWFVLTGKATRLIGHQMQPLEAADLDNRGRSEWVFHSLSGEDDEGYELFYGAFSKHAHFHWSEH
jgi:hypothetical protein